MRVLDEPSSLLTVHVVFRALLRSSLLTLLVLLPALPAQAAAQAPTDSTPVTLESSWPKEGSALWVPPREGRLVFSGPVTTATLELDLLDDAGRAVRGKDLERLTSEQQAEKLIFRIPFLSTGSYTISWSVTTATGDPLSGEIRFTVDPPLTAGGGQNHRHGENAHLYQDSAGEFTLRILGLLPLVLLAAAWLRSRRRGGPARSDRLVVRVGAALLVLVGVVQAIADVVAYVDEFHEDPLSAALAAPAVGVLPLYVLVAGYLLLRAPLDRLLLGCMITVLALHAGLGHLTGGWSALLFYSAYAMTMAGFVLLAAHTLTMLADALRARRPTASQRHRSLLLLAFATGLSSFGMLVVHANGFEFNIDFAADFRLRLLLAAILLVSSAVFGWCASRRAVLWRIGAFPLALIVVGVAAALLWMPPPAAGL